MDITEIKIPRRYFKELCDLISVKCIKGGKKPFFPPGNKKVQHWHINLDFEGRMMCLDMWTTGDLIDTPPNVEGILFNLIKDAEALIAQKYKGALRRKIEEQTRKFQFLMGAAYFSLMATTEGW